MGSAASVEQDDDSYENETSYHSDNGSDEHLGPSGPTTTLKKVVRPGFQKQISSTNPGDRMIRRADSFEQNPIVISRSGFSKQTMQISEGQIVTFVWEDLESVGFNVTQVVHDGEQFRPVVGGIHSGGLTNIGHFEHQFNSEGEYKFVSAGIRCTPLTIVVQSRREIFAKLSDSGFQPSLIRVEQNESIKWSWVQCASPYFMYQATLCQQHCALRRIDTGKVRPTLSGSFIHLFVQPGIYYFSATSDAPSEERDHLCVVEVKAAPKEFRISVSDNSFDPPIVVLEEGDRVWWHWDRFKCQKLHCVYQVDPPPRGTRKQESYRPTKNGFRWPQPSKSGLMSHLFVESGVYFYSDHNFQETAEYGGTIIVKPRIQDHVVNLSMEGFDPDLLTVETGERVWWIWNAAKMEPMFNIMLEEMCVTPACQEMALNEFCTRDCKCIDDQGIKTTVKVGVESFIPHYTGVYHFKITHSSSSMSTSTIIANSGPRNHTVHVTDAGFEPRMLTVHPGDRIWWVWQTGDKVHNILQVTHEGQLMPEGFGSGGRMEPPAAFVQLFEQPGVFYYISEGLPDKFGAIVVTSQPQVREIMVNSGTLIPDPLCAGLNDVVAWIFKGLRQHDVIPIENMGEVQEACQKTSSLTPRRCLNRAMDKTGVYHYASKSFTIGGPKMGSRDSRVSSVLVHEYDDSEVVRITKRGFTPPQTTIRVGTSVLWSWKDSAEEMHNIVHVNPASSDAPLSVIKGDRSFTSGRPVANQSFLYTFDKPGMYCVASIGAPGLSGTVLVQTEVKRVEPPMIPPEDRNQQDGGAVNKGHTVQLRCRSQGARIFYTLDGTPPYPHRRETKSYNPDTGISLRRAGMFFIRSLAVVDNMITSDIYTSERFWVLQRGSGDQSDSELSNDEDQEEEAVDDSVGPSSDSWQWFNCVPHITYTFAGPGILEVFWNNVPSEAKKLIKWYQVFINGIMYSRPFYPGICAVSIEGLAAGRTYNVMVQVESLNPMYLEHKSNTLVGKVPLRNNEGGPIASLEMSEEVDSLTVVWRCVKTDTLPISGYQLNLNGERCGELVVPNRHSSRCKVVLDGCGLGVTYQVQVVAVPEEENIDELFSNLITISLPLDVDDIVLPEELDDQDRTADISREYLVVRACSDVHLEESKSEMAASPKRDLNQIFRTASGEVISDDDMDESESLDEAGKAQDRTATSASNYSTDTLAGVRGRSLGKIESGDTEEEGGDSTSTGGESENTARRGIVPSGRTSSSSSGEEKLEKGQSDGGETFESRYMKPDNDHNNSQSDSASNSVSLPGSLPSSVASSLHEAELIDSHEAEELRFSIPEREFTKKFKKNGQAILAMGNIVKTLASSRTKVDSKQQIIHEQPEALEDSNVAKLDNGATLKSKSARTIGETTATVNSFKQLIRFRRQKRCADLPPDPAEEVIDSDSEARILAAQSLKRRMTITNATKASKEVSPEDSAALRNFLTTQSDQHKRRISVGLALKSSSKKKVSPSALLNRYKIFGQVFKSLKPDVGGIAPHTSGMANLKVPDGPFSQSTTSMKSLTEVKPVPTSIPPPPTRMHVSSSSSDNDDGEKDSEQARLFRDCRKYISSLKKEDFTLPAEDMYAMDIDATGKPWVNQLKAGADVVRTIRHLKQLSMDRESSRRSRPAAAGGNQGSRQPLSQPIEVEVMDEEEQRGAARHNGESRGERSGVGTRRKSRLNLTKRLKEAVIEMRNDDIDLGATESPSDLPVIVPTSLVRNTSQDSTSEDVEMNRLPIAVVELTSANEDGTEVQVCWRFDKSLSHKLLHTLTAINVVGVQFDETNSDLSFISENNDGEPVFVTHVWNVTSGNSCVVSGLALSSEYNFFVTAHFGNKDETTAEQQTVSGKMTYHTAGPPEAPKLSVDSLDLDQISVTWRPADVVLEREPVIGYQLLIDGEKFMQMFPSDSYFTVLDNLKPGRSFTVSVLAVTESSHSPASNQLRVTCPRSPPAPQLNQEPSFEFGTALVSWNHPTQRDCPRGEDIVLFSIFLDDIWRDDVTVLAGKKSYQYLFNNLTPGITYDVTVKATAGSKIVDPSSTHFHCLTEGPHSSPLTISCVAPPASPPLRVETMTSAGIDIVWEAPQEWGEATVSGYRLLKDGEPYGTTLPADVRAIRVKNVSLGDRISLQVVALTEHPVGRCHSKENSESEIAYSNCVPGPKLTVHYTGLVEAPSKVWCESVTGHSAMICWTKTTIARLHHVIPDSFQITWWKGVRPEKEVFSISTQEDQVILEDLSSGSVYAVVVEARKLQSYSGIDEEDRLETHNHHLILTAQSSEISVRTAEPPIPASNLGVPTTTCQSLLLVWDAPHERGTEVISIHVRCAPVVDSRPEDVQQFDLLPDATRHLIDRLLERTSYELFVTAVTEEYFHSLPDGHPMKTQRQFHWPQERGGCDDSVPGDLSWLPTASLTASTSGTLPAKDLKVISADCNTVDLAWQPPVVFGSNRLQGQIIRWSPIKAAGPEGGPTHITDAVGGVDYISLDVGERQLTLKNLRPGSRYRVVVEAVVGVKTVIEEPGVAAGEQNRRTAHVPCEPLLVWTRSPNTPPVLFISEVSESSLTVRWEKPALYALIPDEDTNVTEPNFIRHHLAGYRLLVNNVSHLKLTSGATCCTLTKVKPDKDYSIVLNALTLTQETNQMIGGRAVAAQSDTLDLDTVYDEASSQPINVRIQQPSTPGTVRYLCAELGRGESDKEDVILVSWRLGGSDAGGEPAANIQQISVVWEFAADKTLHRKTVNAQVTHTEIGNLKTKSLYTIYVEPISRVETSHSLRQMVQQMTPGCPDPPYIALKSISDREIVIQWAEPAMYGGVKVSGYQLILNDREVGKVLPASNRRAIIPSRSNRHYRVNLFALTDNPTYPTSEHSNQLFLSTVPNRPTIVPQSSLENVSNGETGAEGFYHGRDLPIRVANRSDTSISIDWLEYSEPTEVTGFCVLWASCSHPQEREHRLPKIERSCDLTGLLPGTMHTVRVTSLAADGDIVDKSKQLAVQTCAPIDTPVLALKACNFNYISVQWSKARCYGDVQLSGYKIFINGVVVSTISANETSYSFTEGEACRDVTFQSQALSTRAGFNSKPSDPLVVMWPGCRPPQLQRISTASSNMVRIGWGDPFLSEGVKIKHFRLVCSNVESKEIVQTTSYLHPDNRQADIHKLRQGTYAITLEIYLHSTQTAYLSEPLIVEPPVIPDPPQVSLTVIGLEERRQMERAACQLINRRDQLLMGISSLSKNVNKTLEEQQTLSRATESYNQLEDMLDHCFTSLSHYTGKLMAKLTIHTPQSNPDIELRGHKILVGGKQYGCLVNPGVASVLVKLGLDATSHLLSAVAVSNEVHAVSLESNVIEVLTEPFLPMTFACIHDVHKPGIKWPKKGSCLYQESLSVERRWFSSRFNPGFLTRPLPTPSTIVRDLMTGTPDRLIPVGGPNKITLVFFWTANCLASHSYLRFISRYADENPQRCSVIAVAFQRSSESGTIRDVLHHVTHNQLQSNIRHCYTLESDGVPDKGAPVQNAVEVFGVPCVPFIVIVHPKNQIIYRGRFCSLDYASFADFLSTVLSTGAQRYQSSCNTPTPTGELPPPPDSARSTHRSQVQQQLQQDTVTANSPSYCIDQVLVDALRKRDSLDESVMRVHQAGAYLPPGAAAACLVQGPSRYTAVNASPTLPVKTETANPKVKFFKKTGRTKSGKSKTSSGSGGSKLRTQLSINTRPYSASNSASSSRMVSPEHRPYSAKKFNS